MEDSAMNEGPIPDGGMMDANMDANIDVDDLFGEAADGLAAEALGVALPAAPLPPSLVLRIMGMQSRGCCTKLAWANTGSIAQITDSGRKIVFRALIRDQKTGAWSLTEESQHPILAPEGTVFEHVQYSGIGIDLSVADSHGSVHVHTLVGALGNMPLAPSNINPSEQCRGDLDMVVGLHWLPVYPTEFRFPYITPAVKIDDKWQTVMRHRDNNEPAVHHAADGKQALLYVTRDTRLTLMFQIETVWHATSMKLENVSSSHELLSHATMCEDGDHLLLVTHDMGKRFRLYKIMITWNPTQQNRQGAQPVIIVAPTFEIGHLTVLEHVAPQQADAARLSDLRLVPGIPIVAAEPTLSPSPTILAVFTRATLPADATQQQQEAYSVVSRWQVESVVPALHESFAKLKVNGTTPKQKPVTVLRRQEDVITNKLVLTVESQYCGTVFAFGASDGTIEFRDRGTMTSIEPYGDTTTISSMPQAGFEQMMTEHNTHVAMSPDGSAVGMIKADGSLVHKMMTLRYSWQPLEDGISDTRGLIETAVVCLARQYSILSCTSSANDETLALLPFDLSTELRAVFIKEIIKMTNRTLDISMVDINRQQMIVVREPLLPRALSAQFVIGTKPGTVERDFAGKFAFAFLNMRLACTGIAQGVTRPDVFARPDYLVSIRGLIKWACDTLIYILNYLVTIKRDSDRARLKDKTATEMFANNIGKTESPVLHILLCSFTRAYIRFLDTFVPKYLTAVQKALPIARSIEERQQLEDVYRHGMTLPFEFKEFGPFIAEFDTAVREAYNTGSVSPDRRSEIEINIVTTPSIPEELHPAIATLLETALPKFIPHVDMVALYFRDTAWIGIEPTDPLADASEGGVYDIIRKLPLTKNTKLRRCRRCPAVMEDLSPEKGRDANWLGHAQRHCVCTNYWVIK